MRIEAGYPCPSCGFLVFDEPAGSFDICPVCEWEDDPVQLRHPGMSGGANRSSLADYQTRFLAEVPAALREHDGFRRAMDWRPLQAPDCDSTGTPESGTEYFQAAADDTPRYYWRDA